MAPVHFNIFPSGLRMVPPSALEVDQKKTASGVNNTIQEKKPGAAQTFFYEDVAKKPIFFTAP